MFYQVPTKTVAAIFGTGTGITNGATATVSIDRLGYDFMQLEVIMATANVVSNTPSTLKLAESDITDSTGYANVVAFTGGTATSATIGFVLPTVADTSNLNIYRMNVDLRARKRYLKLSVTPLTTQEGVMVAHLSRAKESPQTTTAQGTDLSVYG